MNNYGINQLVNNISTLEYQIASFVQQLGLVWFGFFVQWHINLPGLCNTEAIILQGQYWYYLTHRWGYKGLYTFPRSISFKKNVIALLEFELIYYDVRLHLVSHSTTETPLLVQQFLSACSKMHNVFQTQSAAIFASFVNLIISHSIWKNNLFFVCLFFICCICLYSVVTLAYFLL